MPDGWFCYPIGQPELVTLSPRDISKDTTGWECHAMNVENTLTLATRYLYDLEKILIWIP